MSAKLDRALLKTYVRPQWPRAVLLSLLLLAGIGLQLANPQIAKVFIDRAQAGESFDGLVRIGLFFLAVALLTQVATVLETYVADDLGWHRSDAMREREADPRAIMREWGKLTAEVASVVSPIRLLMRDLAATDVDVASVLERAERERLERMRHHARFLKERSYLRDGVSVAEATDILWICSSLEIYELLVVRRGWSLQRFARYVGDFMVRALL